MADWKALVDALEVAVRAEFQKIPPGEPLPDTVESARQELEAALLQQQKDVARLRAVIREAATMLDEFERCFTGKPQKQPSDMGATAGETRWLATRLRGAIGVPPEQEK